MKKILTTLISAALLVSMMSACTTENNEQSSTGSSSTQTSENTSQGDEGSQDETSGVQKLIYTIPGAPPADVERGVADVNAKLAEDGVGVEIELNYIAWDVWDQRLNIMLSTGEPFDMFHVMNDRVTLANYQSRGALADITQYMEEYGQDIISSVPDLAMKSGQVGGVQYGIPVFWVESALNHQGLLRLDILEEYGITETPETFEELTAAFETVMTNWTGDSKPYIPLIGSAQVGGYFFNSDNNYVLYENMIYVNQDGTIQNYFETETFKESCENANLWYEKGLINPDVLTFTNEQLTNQLDTGNWLVHAGTIGSINNVKNYYPDITVDDFAWVDFDTETPEIRPYGTRNLQAIPQSSENPEAGVKFINWLYSNQENYDLFLYGTEGVDYNRIEERGYEAIVDPDISAVPYSFSTWMIGNIDKLYTDVTAPAPVNEHLYVLDENAVEGIAANFAFDASSVQTQYADVTTQISALIAPMAAGVIPYEEGIENALSLLDAAGIDEIVEEYKAQFEASK